MDISRNDWLAGGLGALVIVVLIVIVYMLTKPKDHHLALLTNLDEGILLEAGHGKDGKKWMGMIPIFSQSTMYHAGSSRQDVSHVFQNVAQASPGHLTPLQPKPGQLTPLQPKHELKIPIYPGEPAIRGCRPCSPKTVQACRSMQPHLGCNNWVCDPHECGMCRCDA